MLCDKGGIDLDTYIYVGLYHSRLNSACKSRISADQSHSTKSIVATAISIVKNGIRTEEGESDNEKKRSTEAEICRRLRVEACTLDDAISIT